MMRVCCVVVIMRVCCGDMRACCGDNESGCVGVIMRAFCVVVIMTACCFVVIMRTCCVVVIMMPPLLQINDYVAGYHNGALLFGQVLREELRKIPRASSIDDNPFGNVTFDGTCLSVCLSVCLSLRLSVWMSVYLSQYLCLPVCLSQ